jgi:t-SNARE complex subunit (syntaxin)
MSAVEDIKKNLDRFDKDTKEAFARTDQALERIQVSVNASYRGSCRGVLTILLGLIIGIVTTVVAYESCGF